NNSNGANDGVSDFEQKSNWAEYQLLQNNKRNGDNHSIFLNADYEWPVAENSTLEAGVRTRLNKSYSNNQFFTVDPETDELYLNANANNEFGYSDALYTGSVTFTLKSDDWGFRGGMRLTSVTEGIDQLSNNEVYSVTFTTFVPSL